MEQKIIADGITFDDVLLVPGRSDVVPGETDLSTQLTRKIRLNIPMISAPMDTVTESQLAIALAQEGGIGIIHKNLAIEEQVREVVKVKRSANGVITDPVTLAPEATCRVVRELMEEQNISGVPITENGQPNGKVVGILTRRDMMFLTDDDRPIREVMTKDRLVTAAPSTTLKDAEQILYKNKVEKLLLVDDNGYLTGLITMRDIAKMNQYPRSCRDQRGRLLVGAAVGVHQYERVEAMIAAGVDVITVDSAHGHSENVIETVREVKKRYDIQIIAGNIATEEGARDLIEAGADAIKVGIGPGSICTTRIVTGIGVPQITAVFNAVKAAKDSGVPIVADGGIKQSGDITKAIAAGANTVMLGSLFAGLDESPGELVIHAGRRYKTYRGMGSQGAMMAGSADRYSQKGVTKRDKLVPEGVEGRVPYRGPLGDFVYQMIGGLRAGMGYCGTRTIDELREKSRFVRVSSAGMVESHPHDIAITRESPNYSAGGMGTLGVD
ncbi:Inosine-5'-monophosphate dehydrogenase [Poriferisphaera corsica]|uniref:Inosine-5'-monophosphate dehydrogenase n=1 Tax=Poriferisphaera corsica TaxID=2528020 RepID=A0A517YWI1_9BACT|nr:IMP dehydrogenase [Poriferisphaera corsica]QDU34584.1 Inosine-5'-monophosphate dehydrogenase [Poriferisphaera corsica]